MSIALNIGCGNRQYKEFVGYKCINIDKRKLEGVNIIADIKHLPLKNECADYILASDVIEHFPISKTKCMLLGWARSLKLGGVLELRCPNLKVICENYVSGKFSTRLTSWLLYGGQDYDLNFHYVGFDKEWLTSLLEKYNLKVFDYKEEGTNMILKARRVEYRYD